MQAVWIIAVVVFLVYYLMQRNSELGRNIIYIGGSAMTGGSGGVVNTLVGVLIMGVINNGLTVVIK